MQRKNGKKEKWAMEKLGNRKFGNGKIKQQKKGLWNNWAIENVGWEKGNIYLSQEKTATGTLGNGKLGNSK